MTLTEKGMVEHAGGITRVVVYVCMHLSQD